MRVKETNTILTEKEFCELELMLTEPDWTGTPEVVREDSILLVETPLTPLTKSSLVTMVESTLIAMEKVVVPSWLRVVVTSTTTFDWSIFNVSAIVFWITLATLSEAVLSTVAVELTVPVTVAVLYLISGLGVTVGSFGEGEGVGDSGGLTTVVHDLSYQRPPVFLQ